MREQSAVVGSLAVLELAFMNLAVHHIVNRPAPMAPNAAHRLRRRLLLEHDP